MPRIARARSNTGIYHVIMRGINRQTIFEDREDNEKFIHTLLKYKKVGGYQLFSYCLMGNHVHMLLMEGAEPLETIMRRICGSYVLWYNNKYDRIGNLFQDRFKSIPIEEDIRFLNVLRYIFQNPVKAGLVNRVQDYQWSNHDDYIKRSNRTDTEYALAFFHVDREEAVVFFREFVNGESDEMTVDIYDRKKITDDEALQIICEICEVNRATDIQKFDIVKRNSMLKQLKMTCGLTVRQIERLTGIKRSVIQRA